MFKAKVRVKWGGGDVTLQCCPFPIGGGPKTKKMGRWMRKLVNLSLQITQFGFCCVYFVFMAESIAHVVNNNAGLDLSSRVS